MKVSKEGLREGARIAFRDRIVRGYHELRGDEVSEAMLAINMSVDQWHTFIGMCEGLIGDDEIDQFLTHKSFIVRWHVAVYGSDCHRDKLANDEHMFVLDEVSRFRDFEMSHEFDE